MTKAIESTLKILLVDDDKALLKQMHTMLKNIGYHNIVEVTRLAQAEEHITSRSSVGLVIIDWEMEAGGASDFISSIFEEEAIISLDVIMATRSKEQETILGAIKIGVKQCLLRPILPKTIEDSLIRIMKDKCEKAKERLQNSLEEINQSSLGEEEEQRKQKGVYHAALHGIKEALNFFPWSAVPHYEAGLLYDKIGSLNNAVDCFERVLSLESKDVDACIALASTLRKRKQWTRIIKVLLGFSVGKSSAVILEHLGEAYLMTGETNKAIKAFNDAILFESYGKKTEVLPDRHLAKTHESLGKAYQEKSDETHDKNWQNRAIKSFETSVHYDPVLISAHLNLVSAYKKNGDHEKAAEALSKVAKVTPNSSEDWISLGRLYLIQDEEPKALFALKRALEMSENRQQTLFEIGDALVNFDPEKAISALKNSLKIDSEQPHVLNKLGILYRKKGMIKEALESYLQAINLDDKDEAIHYNLVGVYLANKEDENSRKEAISHLKTAIELKPDFSEAKKLLSQLEKEVKG